MEMEKRRLQLLYERGDRESTEEKAVQVRTDSLKVGYCASYDISLCGPGRLD